MHNHKTNNSASLESFISEPSGISRPALMVRFFIGGRDG